MNGLIGVLMIELLTMTKITAETMTETRNVLPDSRRSASILFARPFLMPIDIESFFRWSIIHPNNIHVGFSPVGSKESSHINEPDTDGSSLNTSLILTVSYHIIAYAGMFHERNDSPVNDIDRYLQDNIRSYGNFKYNTKFIIDSWSIVHAAGNELAYLMLRYGGISKSRSIITVTMVSLAWEVSDGLKRGWWDPECKGRSFRVFTYYSDGFSYSDIISDMIGLWLGTLIK